MSESTIGECLKKFYLDHDLGEDGGISNRFAKVKVGWFPVYIPNTASRKRALFFHDVHHLVTGYKTDLRGEAEIGAWEIGSGCKDYLAAWVLNGGGMVMGLLIAPRRTIRAFLRGRKSRNLYHGFLTREQVSNSTIGEIRDAIGISDSTI